MAKSRPSGAARKADADSGLLREDASRFVLTDEVRNSVLNGRATLVSINAAREMLMQGFSIEAQDNTVCTFGSDLIDKYEKGIKQNNFKRKNGAEIERLKQISLAVMALKNQTRVSGFLMDIIPHKLHIYTHQETQVFAFI